MRIWARFVVLVIFVTVSSGLMAESSWVVVVHAPGSAWNSKLGYSEQNGIDAHRQYLALLAEQGSLAMAGEFTDQPGGLLLLKQVSLEAAREIVQADPLVQTGVLTAELKTWNPELTTMTTARKRKPVPTIPKGATFKIGSPSPEAPINMEKTD